ncbi:MAG: hypothetical protein NW217_14615 [Hyphomicrobiaceae bacterium]|nr:hypothetical protein [Hyphomicrobiaceae bacterium]
MRALLVTLTVLLLALLGLASPVLITTDHADLALRGARLMAADQSEFLITSPLAVAGHEDVVIESGTVSLAKADVAAGGGAQAVLAALAGGDSRLVLSDAVIAVRSDSDMKATRGAAGAPFADVLSRLNFKSITLNDATLRIDASDGSSNTLTDIDAVVGLVGVKRFSAAGTFSFRGQSLNFSVTLDASKRGQAEHQLPFRGSLKGELIEAAFDGQLMPGNGGRLLAPQANIRVADLPRVARWLGLDWPANSPQKMFSASGGLDWYGQVIAFQDADLRFDTNKATGTFSINYRSSRPQIDGTLAFGTLDLSKYTVVPGKSDLGLVANTVLQSAPWLPEGLGQAMGGPAFPLLQQLDADVRLSAEHIIIADHGVGRGAATLSVRNGLLIADVPELELVAGGRGSLQISADATGVQPKYGVRGKLEAIDIGPLIRSLTGTAVLAGRGDVSLDLTAAGFDRDTLLQSLAGKFGIEAAEQLRVGADIEALSSPQTPEAAAAGWGRAAGAVSLAHGVHINGTLSAGIAQIESCRAQTGRRQLIATGSADLPRNEIDLQLWLEDAPADTAGLGMQKGTHVQINGPWATPTISTATYPSRAASPMPADRSDAPLPRHGAPGRG